MLIGCCCWLLVFEWSYMESTSHGVYVYAVRCVAIVGYKVLLCSLLCCGHLDELKDLRPTLVSSLGLSVRAT